MNYNLIIESPELFNEKFDNLLENLKDEKNYEIIKKQILHLFGNQLIFHLNFPKKLQNLPVFRITKEFEGFNKYKAESFSYPRPKESVKLNRANIAENPVFYCASDPKTAIEESKAKDSNIIYLTKWNLNLLNQRYFPFFYETRNRRSSISNMLSKSIEDYIQNLNDEQKIWLKNKLKKFTDLFTLDGDTYYYITSFIAHRCLYEIGSHIKIPMILYPSVSNKGNKINFAIKPEYVDNKSNCNLKSLVKAKLNGKKLEILSHGILLNDDLYWDEVSFKEFYFNDKVSLLINGSLINLLSNNTEVFYHEKKLLLDQLLSSLIIDHYHTIKPSIDFKTNKIIFKEVNSMNLKSLNFYFYFESLYLNNYEEIKMIHIKGFTTFSENLIFYQKVEDIDKLTNIVYYT